MSAGRVKAEGNELGCARSEAVEPAAMLQIDVPTRAIARARSQQTHVYSTYTCPQAPTISGVVFRPLSVLPTKRERGR